MALLAFFARFVDRWADAETGSLADAMRRTVTRLTDPPYSNKQHHRLAGIMTSGSHDKKRKSGGGGGGGPKKSGGNIGACLLVWLGVGVSSICAALSSVLSCALCLFIYYGVQ